MFWENYLQLCNKVGKSANAVAAEIGFKSSGTVTGWKDGKIPYERNLKKIADYFGVTVDDLIGDDSAQKEKPTAQGDGLRLDSYEDIDKWLDTLDGKGLDMVIAMAAAKKVKVNEDKS
jgi:transcriptional regulator with XRE-family HTH domain